MLPFSFRHGPGALLWAWLLLPLATVGSDESCPAGGCAAGEAAKDTIDFRCVRWRQTAGCNPKGAREKEGDQSCDEDISTGRSGYCQCTLNGQKLNARAVTCDHRPLRCSTECLQAERYTCISWRQTGNCSADGLRETEKDASIPPTMSGYCECGAGRIVRKPGCSHGEWSEPFSCADECASEATLYEELGLDSGASDKEIKQAWRKLSLKYHPDKTQNDPTLSARFAQIREAYDILGDEDKRAVFDAAGLHMLFQSAANKVEKGPATNSEVSVTLEQLYNGQDLRAEGIHKASVKDPERDEIQATVPRILICRGCVDQVTERCRKCTHKCANELEIRHVRMGGTNMVMQQQVQVPSKEKCRVQQNRLAISIERGMSAGDTMIFKHQGEQQPKKIPGDVVVKLKEVRHPTFRRAGVDLHTDVNVTLKEAAADGEGWV
eukprot:s4935_g7.t1